MSSPGLPTASEAGLCRRARPRREQLVGRQALHPARNSRRRDCRASAVILDPGTVEGPLHGLQIAVPRWSPDASQIAFIGGLMSDQGATGGDLYTVAAPPDRRRPSDTHPRRHHVSFQWIDWLPRPSTMLATAHRRRLDPDRGLQLHGLAQLPRPARRSRADDQPAHRHHDPPDVPYTASATGGWKAARLAVSRDGSVAAWSRLQPTHHAPEVYAGRTHQAANASPSPTLTTALKPSWGKTESIHLDQSGGFPGEPAGRAAQGSGLAASTRPTTILRQRSTR